MWQTIAAIAGIVTVEIAALFNGIDGVLLSLSIAAIAGLGGYAIHPVVMKKIEEQKQKNVEKKFNSSLDQLPKEVKLLKDIPGLKAGTVFELRADGMYVNKSLGNFAAYDWITVTNLSNWFKPLGEEDINKGAWYGEGEEKSDN